jgi:hypothetical protein
MESLAVARYKYVDPLRSPATNMAIPLAVARYKYVDPLRSPATNMAIPLRSPATNMAIPLRSPATNMESLAVARYKWPYGEQLPPAEPSH